MSWQVGDLAVCVDASEPRRKPGVWRENESKRSLVKGRVYRVSAIFGDNFDEGLVGLQVTPGGWPWLAERFRKIKPADPAFTEQMRSLRPKVEA